MKQEESIPENKVHHNLTLITSGTVSRHFEQSLEGVNKWLITVLVREFAKDARNNNGILSYFFESICYLHIMHKFSSHH